MDTNIDTDKFIILEAMPAKFGNSCHVFISKNFIGKKVKIISGNAKIVKKKLIIDFLKVEISNNIVTTFGTGAHIIVPKEYFGKKIKIILRRKNE